LCIWPYKIPFCTIDETAYRIYFEIGDTIENEIGEMLEIAQWFLKMATGTYPLGSAYPYRYPRGKNLPVKNPYPYPHE
jgi:hypothetical protein